MFETIADGWLNSHDKRAQFINVYRRWENADYNDVLYGYSNIDRLKSMQRMSRTKRPIYRIRVIPKGNSRP